LGGGGHRREASQGGNPETAKTEKRPATIAIKEGAIAGAGLDVFDEEPTQPDNPLFSLDNVIHTPHVAGSTYEVIEHEVVWAAQEVVRILKGQGGKNVLNPEYVKNARR